VGHTVSAAVPGLAQALPAVLQAALNVRRVGTRAFGTQIGAPAVQGVALGDAEPHAVALPQRGVKVVSTGAPPTTLQVSGESGQLVELVATAQPPGSAHVARRVVNVEPAHVGPGAVHVVAVDTAGPQAVPLAQAGVKLVKTGAPAAPVVQVSGASAQLVGVFAARPQPPAALHVAVNVPSRPLVHAGLPAPHADVDSVKPHIGVVPPHAGSAPK
jgi:hypothetical protein